MVFSSLEFIFFFLPAVIFAYFLSTTVGRKHIVVSNIVLLISSLLFYSWGESKLIFLLLFTIILNWIGALLSDRYGKLPGVAVIIVDVIILFLFKYLNWILDIVSKMTGADISIRKILLPIGISFYTFQAISYVVDVMRKDVKASRSPLDVALYISFFPQLIAGPIVRYTDIEKQIKRRKWKFGDISEGTLRFMSGFIKKVILADGMAVIVNKAFDMLETGQLGISFAWLGAIAYTFQIFLDFSAYSDMAIGLGAMFGFKLPENFNKPYTAKSVRDFWRRWHISLSSWFRDYVYIPLGGKQKHIYRNLVIVWLLTGLWHGANWTFVIWGALYGVLIMGERALVIDRKLEDRKILSVAYRIFTLVTVVILWVIFRSDNISQSLRYIRAMFDISTVGTGLNISWMYFWETKFELLACALLSFLHLPETVESNGIYRAIRPIALLILFVVSVSYIVKGSFSPFLYFNF